MIDWDGTHLPEELRQLPPGRYVLSVVEIDNDMSEEEEAAVLAGLDDSEAGHVVPYDAAMRDLRSRIHAR